MIRQLIGLAPWRDTATRARAPRPSDTHTFMPRRPPCLRPNPELPSLPLDSDRVLARSVRARLACPASPTRDCAIMHPRRVHARARGWDPVRVRPSPLLPRGPRRSAALPANRPHATPRPSAGRLARTPGQPAQATPGTQATLRRARSDAPRLAPSRSSCTREQREPPSQRPGRRALIPRARRGPHPRRLAPSGFGRLGPRRRAPGGPCFPFPIDARGRPHRTASHGACALRGRP